jgi:hypothetical protein
MQIRVSLVQDAVELQNHTISRLTAAGASSWVDDDGDDDDPGAEQASNI